jgi:tetratricopeptide (TPR) repeat protein
MGEFNSYCTAAGAELNRATQLDQSRAVAWLELGRLQQQRGDLKAALARYQKALFLQPKSLAFTILLAHPYEANKDDLEKTAHYDHTPLTLDSGSGVAANDLAWVFALQNQPGCGPGARPEGQAASA